MNELHGAVASPGFASGTAVVYALEDLTYSHRTIEDSGAETARLGAAVNASIDELQELKTRVLGEMGEEFAHIFRSQQTIAEDESLIGEINKKIEESHVCAEEAVDAIFSTYRAMFEELGDDDYNKARIADLEDVHTRILRALLGVKQVDLSDLPEGSIVVAEELLPSDTARMNKNHVIGMLTERGGITSHVAILAKSLGIPAAVGVESAATTIPEGAEVILDATASEKAVVYLSPDEEDRTRLLIRLSDYQRRQEMLAQEKNLDPVTKDRHRITLSGNIGSVEEIAGVLGNGAQSVGLFRSEFLFMNGPGLPDEEEQFHAYRAAAESFAEGFVVLRTLDIGGDKPVESISLPKEENPFLGFRAIRISLDQPELLETQLRAALRASAFGTIRIMFPMISGPNEIIRIRAVLDKTMNELAEYSIDFDRDIEIGIMIEIPSTLFLLDELLDLVDFMSVGTNDLTQYLLAADRTNERVQEFYQVYHPAVFRAIAAVTDAAHKRGKWVGVCGELGGMPMAIPALIGLGVDELSMNPQSVPEAVHIVRNGLYTHMKDLARDVLKLDDSVRIKALLKREYEERE